MAATVAMGTNLKYGINTYKGAGETGKGCDRRGVSSGTPLSSSHCYCYCYGQYY
jgi:hypothetical protein